MNNTREYSLAGSMAYWTLAETSEYQAIADQFQAANLGKFIPEKMTAFAALKGALDDEFTGAQFQVFNVKNDPTKGGPLTFEVVQIRAEDKDTPEEQRKRNQYDHVLTAWVGRNDFINTDIEDYDLKLAREGKLTASFKRDRLRVPYANLSHSLREIVYHMGGTCLRPNGGVYWVPNSQWDRWEMVTQAVEKSNPATNKVFSLRAIMDIHAAVALREALSLDVARETKAISDTVDDPDAGERALRTAKQRAASLRAKIEQYETEFNMSLADLTKAVDTAEGLEAVAELLDAACDGGILGHDHEAEPSEVLA